MSEIIFRFNIDPLQSTIKTAIQIKIVFDPVSVAERSGNATIYKMKGKGSWEKIVQCNARPK